MNRGPLVTGLLLLGVLAACGDDAAADDPVLGRIAALDTCTEAQAEFDTAYRDNSRAAPGTERRRATLEYMQAAQERLEELNCP